MTLASWSVGRPLRPQRACGYCFTLGPPRTGCTVASGPGAIADPKGETFSRLIEVTLLRALLVRLVVRADGDSEGDELLRWTAGLGHVAGALFCPEAGAVGS